MAENSSVGESEASRILERFRSGSGGKESGPLHARGMGGRPAVLHAVSSINGAGRGWVVAALVVPLGLAAVLLWQGVGAPAPIEERMPQAVGSASGAGRDSGSTADRSTGPAVGTPSGNVDGQDGADDAATGVVLVHVAGAVMRPGVVELPAESRVDDAVGAAGGLAPGADPNRVNLAAPLLDGSWIVIPVVGEFAAPVQVPTSAPPGGADAAAGEAGATAPLVDLNTAEAADLEELPGVGPATAEAILDYRNTSGPFGAVDDLLSVRGIGEAKLEALRDQVTVSSSGSPG
jgi:competence protein ComEA